MVIDESGREPEDQHGGGILIRDSTACVVRQCRAQHQWDGIDVVRSHDNKITDSDFSVLRQLGPASVERVAQRISAQPGRVVYHGRRRSVSGPDRLADV